MNRKDSVKCAGCSKDFELTLLAMVRRRPMWCDSCIAVAGGQGSHRTAQEPLAGVGEGVDKGSQ